MEFLMLNLGELLMLNIKYLFRYTLYRNAFWYGWKTAVYLENLSDNFDDLIKLLDKTGDY